MTGTKLDWELDRDALDDNDQGLVTEIAADRPERVNDFETAQCGI
jgi:hypothetical protein